ncbi:cupin [Sphingomonas sp. Leaf33]|nr:cupin domain-containing protein [Sphingomonas sp. Leaf33]KQN26858.1 cupin [Sphingomonas sp. Leaf33]
MAALLALSLQAAPPMVVVDEKDVMKREAVPHGAIGMSTAWRITDAVPGRTFEFRRRALDKGAAIGLHVLAHDEVYYVLAGEGEVDSDGVRRRLGVGMTAYLYEGANVGIRQTGTRPLSLIVAYPLKARVMAE